MNHDPAEPERPRDDVSLPPLPATRTAGRVFGVPHDFQTRWLTPLMKQLFARLPQSILHRQVYYRLSQGSRDRYSRVYRHALFDTVNIETRSVCNGKCAFCPASQPGLRPDRHMPWSTFQTVIDQLAVLRFPGEIAFYINNEPLLDKRLPEMIAYARQACPAASLTVSTNGILLTLDRARELFGAGTDRLLVNLYTPDQSWYPRVHEIARELPEPLWKKTYVFLRRVDDTISNRAGSSPNLPQLAQSVRAFCELPFNQINIATDGQVGLCCQDYFFSENLGNVTEQQLLSIWFGPKYRRIRDALLDYDRTATRICSVCDYHGFKQLIGPYAAFRRFVPWLWW